MPWFPDFHYRDVAGWRAEGLPLTTTSDEAAKFLDAAVAQMALMDNDDSVGGLEGSLAKAAEADPEMVMPKVFMMGAEAMGRININFIWYRC